jgi:transaldolase/glucose-6-phosphate isomerase
MTAGAIERAHDLGISLWLDYISRRLVAHGELARLIEQDHLAGVTSNPIIFGKAISEDPLYKPKLDELPPGIDAEEATFTIMMQDVRDAADALHATYERSGLRDGFVSLEVSPHFAHSYSDTVSAARSLWDAVDRPNLLIKIPATAEGIAAFEDCIVDGIGVNVTVIFSAATYESVARAHLRAMERRQQAGLSLDVASYASVFVGRLDPPIDALLDDRSHAASSKDQRRRLESLRGRGALANAELIYARALELEAGPASPLKAGGGRFQPIIWASLGARGEAPAAKYVNRLLAPGTVLTMPEATLDAFRDHGDTAHLLGSTVDEARATWDGLRAEGIYPDRITAAMEEEILRLFAEAYDGMVAEVEAKLPASSAVPG